MTGYLRSTAGTGTTYTTTKTVVNNPDRLELMNRSHQETRDVSGVSADGEDRHIAKQRHVEPSWRNTRNAARTIKKDSVNMR